VGAAAATTITTTTIMHHNATTRLQSQQEQQQRITDEWKNSDMPPHSATAATSIRSNRRGYLPALTGLHSSSRTKCRTIGIPWTLSLQQQQMTMHGPP
jgi:hypothetical protein